MSAIEAFSKKFDEYDLKGDGIIGFSDFHKLCEDLEGKDLSEAHSRVLFNGLVFDSKDALSKEEYIRFTEFLLNENHLKVCSVVFRGFDEDRSCSLTMDQSLRFVEYLDKKCTREHLQDVLLEETGKRKGRFTFNVLYKYVSGKEIDLSYDPYEGRIMKSSKCCFIL